LKVRLKVSALYNIAVYALTLPIILNLMYIIINMFTGFTVKYFQVMYTAISYIYVISSIYVTSSIKKQRELMKIMSELEKVKEEIARKEREKKEQEEKERIRKRDEEESEKEQKENATKKKKAKKETDVGEQPEGTNA